MPGQRVVLLTGAGFSVPAGYDTLRLIVDSIRGVHIPLNNQSPEVQTVKATWDIVQSDKGDNATLEHLLARIKHYSETADMIRNNSIFAQNLQANLAHIYNGQFKSLWENALSYCFNLVLENYGPHKVNIESDGYKLIVKALKRLAELNDNCLHIFTTNYDCLLHVIASNTRDINFYSHISNQRDQNGQFQNDWFVTNPDMYNASNPNIYVHRLHGCVAWFFDLRAESRVHEVFGAGKKLTIRDPQKLNQMAIKLISNDNIGSIPAFSRTFTELYHVLGDCGNLLVWGHSFRDLELLRCMISVLENRKEHPYKTYFIDPYENEDTICENITNTVMGVPGIPCQILSPKEFGWLPDEGLNSFNRTIKRIIG